MNSGAFTHQIVGQIEYDFYPFNQFLVVDEMVVVRRFVCMEVDARGEQHRGDTSL